MTASAGRQPALLHTSLAGGQPEVLSGLLTLWGLIQSVGKTDQVLTLCKLGRISHPFPTSFLIFGIDIDIYQALLGFCVVLHMLMHTELFLRL